MESASHSPTMPIGVCNVGTMAVEDRRSHEAVTCRKPNEGNGPPKVLILKKVRRIYEKDQKTWKELTEDLSKWWIGSGLVLLCKIDGDVIMFNRSGNEK